MKLVPFSECPEAVEAAKKGIAVSVTLDASDYEPHHRNNYYMMLGFNGDEHLKICTILSEIMNMPHHYVVLGKNGNFVPGLHDDIFYVDLEDLE